MGVVDTERLETALVYLQRIIDGRNPVNNMPLDEDTVVNNPNVVRCMSFIKDVLVEVKYNSGYIGKRPKFVNGHKKYYYPTEVLKTFQYSGDKTITQLVGQLNGLDGVPENGKLVYMPIIRWLKQHGYLAENIVEGSRKRSTITTAKGIELGIKPEKRKNSSGVEYTYITYNKTAQEFIVANMGKILGN